MQNTTQSAIKSFSLLAILAVCLAFFLLPQFALANRATIKVFNCSGYEIIAVRFGAGFAYQRTISNQVSRLLKCKTRTKKGQNYCRMRAYYSETMEPWWGYKSDVYINKATAKGGVCVSDNGDSPVFSSYCSGCLDKNKESIDWIVPKRKQ